MNNLWALEDLCARNIAELIRSNDITALTSEQLNTPDPEINIQDGIAYVPIKGILTPESVGGFARFFMGSGTTYEGIIANLKAADSNPAVTSIVLDIDSPGGTVAGVYDAVKAINATSKPITAHVKNMAASAAYLLAAQAGSIRVNNAADMVGSIGTLASFFVSKSIINITSTDAPFKAPDPSTLEGEKAIRQQLDMSHKHLVDGIASGRGVTVETINKDFGRGMVFTADIAIENNMIDAIGFDTDTNNPKGIAATPQDKGKTNTPKTTATGGKNSMDLMALLNENPEARVQYQADILAATGKGVTGERKRVTAHLASIEHSKDVVIKSIVDGAEYDETSMATYMNAGLKHQHGQHRAGDNPDGLDTGDGDDGLGDNEPGDDNGVAKALGKGIDSALGAAESDAAFKY